MNLLLLSGSIALLALGVFAWVVRGTYRRMSGRSKTGPPDGTIPDRTEMVRLRALMLKGDEYAASRWLRGAIWHFGPKTAGISQAEAYELANGPWPSRVKITVEHAHA